MQLALTPQTERCFLSLTSALSAVRTGCLVGNSSVGKRQTLAQLAQACGQHLQEINCDSHLNNQTVSWYIKGLASSGSWLLFDKIEQLNQSNLLE
jgi:dynein heavy chain